MRIGTGLIPLIAAYLFAVPHARAADRDTPLDPGFEYFYNLDYEQALAAFAAEAAKNPSSADAQNHIAQTVLYREMFRSGALESEMVTGTNPFLRREKLNPTAATQRQFDDCIRRAMDLAGERLKKNPDDVGALYSLGVSYGLRANYRFLVKKAWLDGLRDATSSRNEHNHATKLNSDLVDARLVEGLYDYIVGSLPLTWKMLGFLAGFHGDRERGIHTLETVASKGHVNRYDATVILCAILRREHRTTDTIPLLDALIQRFPRNFLFRMELVQMYGDLGNKEKALAEIDEVERLKQSNAPGYDRLPQVKIFYARGNLLFWYNDLDPAIDNLKAAAAKANETDLNTGVYAWLRLGQAYDLKEDRGNAIAAYRETIRYAPDSDAAKEARGYVSSRYRR